MKIILDKNDPILRQIANPIPESEFGSIWLKELIQDMFIIMKEKCAVGVAAPQIGISKRVIVFGSAYTKRQNLEYSIPNTALINPSLNVLSDEIQIGYEGCLNFEEIMGKVPRAMEIEYSGYDVDGNFISKKTYGLEARILQHEIDHLNGYLFLDHIQDKRTLTTKSELQNKV
ncbi:MAG: peptide deformylase [Legionella sp.]|uniref:peptide deformylase n=1 Tax=Legionella sp. TaxID=459 RepID=UPI0039E656C2